MKKPWLATAGALAIVIAGAQPAGAQPFPGFAWVEEPALAFRASISVPGTLPDGSVAQYAWVMAEGGNSFTQVGWAWWPGKQPQVFAYSAPISAGASGTWALGPTVTPGSTLTVQITRDNGFLDDQYNLGGWSTLQGALVPPDDTYITQMEDDGPAMPTCFTSRGWESAPQVWHHLASGCFSQ